jgi:hypothetical protein
LLQCIVSGAALLVAVVMLVLIARLQLTSWWRSRRQGCGHTRYRGRADVVCIACHRERHRFAAHVAQVTTNRSGGSST